MSGRVLQLSLLCAGCHSGETVRWCAWLHVGLSLQLLPLMSTLGDPVLQPLQCSAVCFYSAQTVTLLLVSGRAWPAPYSTTAAVLFALCSCRLHVPADAKKHSPVYVHLTHQPEPWRPVHPCRPRVGAA